MHLCTSKMTSGGRCEKKQLGIAISQQQSTVKIYLVST